MNICRIHGIFAGLIALVAVASISFLNPSTADAATPAPLTGITGATTTPAMLFLLGRSRVGSKCTFDNDCAGSNICHSNRCTPPHQVQRRAQPAEQPQEPTESQSESQRTADTIIDDGGADAACGLDRRCRIERMKARNRFRRHYQTAHYERVVRHNVDRMLAEKEEEVIRAEKPWIVAFQRHTKGLGLLGGYAFNDHFRAEATLVFQDRSLYFEPGDSTAPTLSSYHSAYFGTAHLTFLPSRAWFSPLLSVGFGMGQGDYSGSSGPNTRFHYITSAVGAEAQFNVGLMLRIAYRYGYSLHTQAFHGPGNYESGLRSSFREYMNSEALRGIDFSIGWAF